MRRVFFVLLCLIITSIVVNAQQKPIMIASEGAEPIAYDCLGKSVPDALSDILGNPEDYTWIVDSQAKPTTPNIEDVDGSMDLTMLDLKQAFLNYELIIAIPKC